MPDTWEYPWFAAWDLAFHCIPLALIDPDFAKRQLVLLTREWYMHPNGQLPAYEWAFWTSIRRSTPGRPGASTRSSKRITGRADRGFLERVFHKLLLNFTWWVNRKDRDGHNVFQGGFLGLDNIGVFDRSARLPSGGHLGPGRRHGVDGLLLPPDAADRPRAGRARTTSTRTSRPSSSSTSCTSPARSTTSADRASRCGTTRTASSTTSSTCPTTRRSS